MGLSAKIRRAPLRLTTGAFILNAGVAKFNADDETSKSLHGMAAGTFPPLEKVDPRVFAKALSVGEIALGGALLLPIVPASVAGAGLLAFSGSLLATWWRTPGMHAEGSPRPTQQGTAVAKDVWMFGAGASLLLDALTSPAHDKKLEVSATVHEKAAAKKRALRRSRKAAAAAGAATAAQLLEGARNAQSDTAAKAKDARKVTAARAKDARKATAATAKDARKAAAAMAKDARKATETKTKDARKAAKQLAETARESAQDVGERIQSAVK